MTLLRATLAILPLLLLGACGSDPPPAGPLEVGALETSDYAEAPTPSPDAATGQAAAPDATRYTLDGLVGQVNGRPVYARTIVAPIHEQLTQIARQYSGPSFQEQAVSAITYRVNEVVQNALILGEAERDLTEDERQGLAVYVEEHRAELLRRYGRGSVAVAEQALREDRGLSLDETLEEYRAYTVVQRYLYQKLIPQVNVTRRDIERYYRDHPEIFNPPATRTIRLISVAASAEAQAVSDALASAGADFAELATGEFNRFRSDTGGLMAWTPRTPLAIPAMNERVTTLNVGEHAGPYQAPNGALWFVYLEAVDQPPAQPLKDAQVQIEQTLRKQQMDVLRGRFLDDLYARGNYTPRDQMVARLYAIVEARYKAPAAP